MPSVSFPFDAQVVSVRREACPRARWNRARRVWTMTRTEAEAFFAASHTRMDLCRSTARIAIDDELWLARFAKNATGDRRRSDFLLR
jgi:hypothetical protein